MGGRDPDLYGPFRDRGAGKKRPAVHREHPEARSRRAQQQGDTGRQGPPEVARLLRQISSPRSGLRPHQRGDRDLRRAGALRVSNPEDREITAAPDPVYPAPQNLPHASTGTNGRNSPEAKNPKVTDVRPWYGVYFFAWATSSR